MERIYFDNAATTPLDPLVLDTMLPYLTEKFGNPSSIYSYGRESRMAIEQARKTVATLLHAHPAEIFFTSGGTESSNAAIRASVQDLGCRHIISSPLEHHATLHTVMYFQERGEAKLHFLNVLPDGHVDLNQLDSLLNSLGEKTLVSLMHANNETGNLLDIARTAEICKKYQAVFHSDTVQTLGHYPFDLSKLPVHFITGASHKFHGPKGVGMLYINEQIKVKPIIHGGSQERNMRAGTENVYGIVGFAKALELATNRMEEDSHYINSLRMYMAEELKREIPGVEFNGDAFGKTLYTILSVSFPKSEKSEMLLFNLDINQICASGGSACTSGAQQGSHVIRAIYPGSERTTVRFSFSRHNNRKEIDEVVEKLKSLI
jgi:cysteine desulfurase